MRILMVIPQMFYSTRGTPLSAYHRTRELVAKGHEVDILTYKPGDAPPQLKARVFRSAGPHFADTIVPGPSRLKVWFDVLLLLNLFWRLLRKRYDLLYAHEEGAFLSAIAGGILRVPYVYDMHSSLPLQITEWKFSKSPRVVAFFQWVERVSIERARGVVAISPAVARAAKAAVPVAEVVTIVNHFDLDPAVDPQAAAALRQRLGITPRAPLVVYTGSFVELQALDLLVDSIPAVRQAVPEVIFLLVGAADDDEIAPLAAQAERLGVRDCVVFERARPQSEMPVYMAAADVLVSPRVRGINPPGKLLPYLASGRPVVATDTLVHNQLLDSSCAFLTTADAAGFAAGVTAAIQDKERAATTVATAKEFLATYCSDEARAEAYERLMKIASRPRVRP